MTDHTGPQPRPFLPPGEPCDHLGCLSHVSHPCEGCGRTAGRYPDENTAPQGQRERLARALYEADRMGADTPWDKTEADDPDRAPYYRLAEVAIDTLGRAPTQEEGEPVHQMFLEWRSVGVGNACAECGGSGVKMYATTATWRGGIGGAAMTPDVCDVCWGSGANHRQGANLRRLVASVEAQPTPPSVEERPRRTYAEGYAEGVMDAIDKLDKYRDRYEKDQRKIAELRDLLEAATHEGPWVWEAGGDNDLDSLTCPILITADALRDLLAPPSAEVEAERYRDSAMLHATRLGAMVRWLEAHHPEVFREGLWDAIATAEPTPQVLAALRTKGGTE